MNNTLCKTNTLTTDILGYSSTVIFTILLMPQVYKTTKTKSSKDISMLFLCLSELGCCLMIPYTILLDLKPVLISNVIMLTLNTYLMGFKGLEIYKN